MLIRSNKAAVLALALIFMLVGSYVAQVAPQTDDEDVDAEEVEEASGNDSDMDNGSDQAAAVTTIFDRKAASSTTAPPSDTDDEDVDPDDGDDNDDLDAPNNQAIGGADNEAGVNAPSKEIVPAYESSTPAQVTYQSTRSKLLAIISKPGILAGIVGGAVIGILTAILLIMFIVYRMRKKDEGSYALEESKKPLSAYDYRHCPTKEFYA